MVIWDSRTVPPNAPMDREDEISRLASRPDSYEIVVRFTRSLGDDLNCGGDEIAKDQPIGAALRCQFIAELQDAYDTLGMAGHFTVVSGPSLELGHHLPNGSYIPIDVRTG